MLCEICKKNTATVHFKQIAEGVAKEVYVCQACAEQHGFSVQMPSSVTDFLFGIGMAQEEARPAGEDKACPACHMRGSDFKKTSRLGCPACYEAFSEELAPLLGAMQKGTQHAGKVPASEKVTTEIEGLKKALERAVAAQDFEEAAKLRDRVRDLKASRPAGSETPGA